MMKKLCMKKLTLVWFQVLSQTKTVREMNEVLLDLKCYFDSDNEVTKA